MQQTLFALSLGFAGLMIAPQASLAQAQQCAPRAALVAHLTEKYGETRRGLGLAGPDTMMEVYASADTGTWTITMTLANGTMCMVASGQGYEALAEELPAKGEPA
ncbi:MAG: hypothetical protein MUD11_04530 [Rhodobacteraceae bacterium]|nr:hypothetical protein [Paracoccaceae bacterium]